MQVLLQKAKMRKLSSMGHDSSDLERAIKIAREDGDSLHTGVFYRNPNPPGHVRQQGQGVEAKAGSSRRIEREKGSALRLAIWANNTFAAHRRL